MPASFSGGAGSTHAGTSRGDMWRPAAYLFRVESAGKSARSLFKNAGSAPGSASSYLLGAVIAYGGSATGCFKIRVRLRSVGSGLSAGPARLHAERLRCVSPDY